MTLELHALIISLIIFLVGVLSVARGYLYGCKKGFERGLAAGYEDGLRAGREENQAIEQRLRNWYG